MLSVSAVYVRCWYWIVFTQTMKGKIFIVGGVWVIGLFLFHYFIGICRRVVFVRELERLLVECKGGRKQEGRERRGSLIRE
jgi:hypothetical protein